MKIKIKAQLEVKKKKNSQQQNCNTSRRNKKHLDVPGSFLYESGLQVKFLSLSSEELELIPGEITSIFYYCLLPHLLSEQIMLGLGPRLLAAGGAECHSIADGCKGFTQKGSCLQQP